MTERPLTLELEHAPDLNHIAAAWPGRYPFLLDSAARGPLGRFSLLLRHGGESLCMRAPGRIEGPGSGRHFLERLQEWYRALRLSPPNPARIPFCGGWFLYLGYELAGEIEPVLDLPGPEDGLPLAVAARCEGAVLVRHEEPATALLIAETPEVLEAMREELRSVGTRAPGRVPKPASLQSDPAEAFEEAVKRIHEYLLAGDVFQVNLSRGWRGRFPGKPDPLALYDALRRANPAPFAGWMRWEDRVLMSSSPERLVEVAGERVQTRPIAGTHPRGQDRESDLALSREMLASPKERAEHIMLIDLERNDLGRVCVSGSVEVSELMVVESYAHVHHIVSNVRGRLRPDVTPVDVIRAVFPGGTITGCPKVRCMQIIAELEGCGRGFYTGSMGYLDRHGNMDLNILIRSMLLDGRRFSFRTGAGIVADSVPRREVAETEAKARGLLRALRYDDAIMSGT